MPKSHKRKKKKHTNKASNVIPIRQATREWIGLRVPGPYVQEEQSFMTLELWMSLPDGFVVHQELFLEGQEVITEELINKIIRDHPRRIRVANRKLAHELRELLPGITIKVGDVPELEAVVKEMIRDMGGGPSSYLTEDINSDLMATLFDSAASFYRLRPWEKIEDWQTIGVDIPALGISGGCISIMGSQRENFGYMLFQSYSAYDKMVEQSDGLGHGGELNLGESFFSLSFERGVDCPEPLREEVRQYQWELVDSDAYPLPGYHSNDGRALAMTAHEVAIFCAVNNALTAMLVKNLSRFEQEAITPFCESYFDDDDLEVIFTVPPAGISLLLNGAIDDFSEADLNAIEEKVTPIQDLHFVILTKLNDFGRQRWPEALALATQKIVSIPAGSNVADIWVLFHSSVEEGSTVAEWFLREGNATKKETDVIHAQLASWLSIWEVQGIQEDGAIVLFDELTGVQRTIYDVSLLQEVIPGTRLLARIVDAGSFAVTSGVHSQLLDHILAADVVTIMRKYLRRKSAVDPSKLRQDNCGKYLLRKWQEQCDQASIYLGDDLDFLDDGIDDDEIDQEELTQLLRQYKATYYNQ